MLGRRLDGGQGLRPRNEISGILAGALGVTETVSRPQARRLIARKTQCALDPAKIMQSCRRGHDYALPGLFRSATPPKLECLTLTAVTATQKPARSQRPARSRQPLRTGRTARRHCGLCLPVWEAACAVSNVPLVCPDRISGYISTMKFGIIH
jgi:hypothetical protein